MSFNSDIFIKSGNSILSLIPDGTINIGKNGQIVNLLGDTITINTTNLEINDNLITINKNGLINSGAGAGIEFEENGTTTSYIKVSGDRNNMVFKAPNGNEQIIGNSSSSLLFKTIFNNASFSSIDNSVSGTLILDKNSECLFNYNGCSYGIDDTFTLSVSGVSGTTVLGSINTSKNVAERASSHTGFETATLSAGTYTVTITASGTINSSLDYGSCAVFYYNL